MATLTGHEDTVQCLAVLEGGRLASGSFDQTIKIWEVATSSCLATLEGHKEGISSLAALEGGKLVSGSYDGKILFWDSSLSDIIQ